MKGIIFNASVDLEPLQRSEDRCDNLEDSFIKTVAYKIVHNPQYGIVNVFKQLSIYEVPTISFELRRQLMTTVSQVIQVDSLISEAVASVKSDKILAKRLPIKTFIAVFLFEYEI